MIILKQSAAANIYVTAVNTGSQPVTSISDANWTKRISKNGAAFSYLTGTMVELERGVYTYPLGVGDVDTLGQLCLMFLATGSLNVVQYYTIRSKVLGETMDANVVSMAAATLTEAAIATNAISATKIASGAITAGTLANDTLTANKVATNTLTSGKFAAGAFTAGIFAAEAIGITALATGSLHAVALATDAATELAAQVWNTAAAAHVFPGTMGATLNTAATGSSAATLAAAVWDRPIAGHLIAGSTGVTLFNAGSGSGAPSAAVVAAAVWDKPIAAHLVAGSAGAVLHTANSGTHISDTVWDEQVAAHLVAGSTGATLHSANSGSLTANNVWAFAHESGRTTKGVMRRLDALMTGKATGLLGTVYALFAPDGTTKLVEATQDVDLGTRETASTVAGD